MRLNDISQAPIIATATPPVGSRVHDQLSSPIVAQTTHPDGALPTSSQADQWNRNAQRFSSGLSRLVEKLRRTTAITLPDDVILDAIRSEIKQLEQTLVGNEPEVLKHRILAVNPPSLRQLEKELKITYEGIRQIEQSLVRRLLNSVRFSLTKPRDRLNIYLEYTNLPRRAVNLLRLHQIFTFGHLIAASPDTIRAIPKLGIVCFTAIDALRNLENT